MNLQKSSKYNKPCLSPIVGGSFRGRRGINCLLYNFLSPYEIGCFRVDIKNVFPFPSPVHGESFHSCSFPLLHELVTIGPVADDGCWPSLCTVRDDSDR